MSIRELLNPTNSTLILIDHQPQMAFGVQSIDRQTLKNNTVALAKAAKIFNVPTILTSVETESFSGYIWPELLSVFPDQQPIERTSMNSWEDKALVAAVKATGRKKLIMAALWTEVCLNFPALEALADGLGAPAWSEPAVSAVAPQMAAPAPDAALTPALIGATLAAALPKVSFTGPRGELRIDPATNNIVQPIHVYETVPFPYF